MCSSDGTSGRRNHHRNGVTDYKNGVAYRRNGVTNYRNGIPQEWGNELQEWGYELLRRTNGRAEISMISMRW